LGRKGKEKGKGKEPKGRRQESRYEGLVIV